MTNEITVQELQVKLLANETLTLIDVRTPEEFAAGHIAGAVNIPVNTLEENIGQVANKPNIFVNCKSGGRSGVACVILKAHGIEATNVSGGFGAWQMAGFPAAM